MGLNILLVDDDHLVSEPTKLILEMVGPKVDLFSSSKKALSAFSKDVDVLFVDYYLADLNGLELCNKLRLLNQNLETVFYTGDINNHELKAFVNDKGNNAYFLSKPASIDQITETLEIVARRLVCV